MGINSIFVFGDSELIIKQIKNHYQTKHPRLRAYRNEVWDLVENSKLLTFNLFQGMGTN